jgi:hypothetical protein
MNPLISKFLKTPASRRAAKVFGQATGNRTADARAIAAYDDIVAGKNILNTIGANRIRRAVESQMNNRSIIEKLKDIIPGHKIKMQRQFAANTKHPAIRSAQIDINNLNRSIASNNGQIVDNLGHFGGWQRNLTLNDIIDQLYK